MSFKNRLNLLLTGCLLSSTLLTAWMLSFSPPIHSAEAQVSCSLPALPAFPSKVGFYVLAFDNDPKLTHNLEDHYEKTKDRLVSATGALTDSIVVILADLSGEGDTHLIIGSGGVETRINCLPNSDGVLSADEKEWDVADGKRLAMFLVWGRDNFVTGASATVFSYIGHGLPVAPHTEPSIYELITQAGKGETLTVSNGANGPSQGLSPLPTRLNANPSFTDYHAPTEGAQSLITPHALEIALSAFTDGGSNPIDVIDLFHCFAASIDELSELAPYGQGIVASPNYAFYDPEMPGTSFEVDNLVEDVVTTYSGFHPPSGHPHIIMAAEADTISTIRDEWDIVSDELMKEFDLDSKGTVEKLEIAYRKSVKYDTTTCEENQDWALEPPDALSDMKSFAIELQTAYGGANPTLNSALTALINEIENNILGNVAVSGVPYFDDEDPVTWTFLGGESGISLFTPFETTLVDDVRY
ncbi:MAG: hypothetical protein AAF633_10865, partial [Chloroflexota bacterium]